MAIWFGRGRLQDRAEDSDEHPVNGDAPNEPTDAAAQDTAVRHRRERRDARRSGTDLRNQPGRVVVGRRGRRDSRRIGRATARSTRCAWRPRPPVRNRRSRRSPRCGVSTKPRSKPRVSRADSDRRRARVVGSRTRSRRARAALHEIGFDSFETFSEVYGPTLTLDRAEPETDDTIARICELLIELGVNPTADPLRAASEFLTDPRGGARCRPRSHAPQPFTKTRRGQPTRARMVGAGVDRGRAPSGRGTRTGSRTGAGAAGRGRAPGARASRILRAAHRSRAAGAGAAGRRRRRPLDQRRGPRRAHARRGGAGASGARRDARPLGRPRGDGCRPRRRAGVRQRTAADRTGARRRARRRRRATRTDERRAPGVEHRAPRRERRQRGRGRRSRSRRGRRSTVPATSSSRRSSTPKPNGKTWNARCRPVATGSPSWRPRWQTASARSPRPNRAVPPRERRSPSARTSWPSPVPSCDHAACPTHRRRGRARGRGHRARRRARGTCTPAPSSSRSTSTRAPPRSRPPALSNRPQ